MKTAIHSYSMYVCEKEISHLRQHHPCLLNQAYEHGYEYTSSEHHFYGHSKRLNEELKKAITDSTYKE